MGLVGGSQPGCLVSVLFVCVARGLISCSHNQADDIYTKWKSAQPAPRQKRGASPPIRLGGPTEWRSPPDIRFTDERVLVAELYECSLKRLQSDLNHPHGDHLGSARRGLSSSELPRRLEDRWKMPRISSPGCSVRLSSIGKRRQRLQARPDWDRIWPEWSPLPH